MILKRLSIKQSIRILVCYVFAVLAMLAPTMVYAGDIQLTIKPKKCVSLYQGQACYQKFKISWYAMNQPLCLYIRGQENPEKCSDGLSKANHAYSFEGSSEVIVELRDSEKNIVASNKIEVVSVYKGKSRLRSTTGWRLF